jgi:hypothetical protein
MNSISHYACLALLVVAVAVVSSCGGGGSSTPVSSAPATFKCTAPSGSNSVTLAVDAGPTDANGVPVASVVNQSYVTINVYVPGSGSCQTIDHVWVDTGSTGLRLFTSAFTNTLPLSQQNGSAVANCAQFVSASYTWGAVRMADVRIGSELASSVPTSVTAGVPIQVIGDAAVPATAPSSCNNGAAQNTAALLGANGLLGVGVFQQDCGLGCEVNSPPPASFYYTCPGGNCQPVNMARTAQVQNVVGLFATDNNGVLIQLPMLGTTGQATASGTLTFLSNALFSSALTNPAVFTFAANPTNGYIDTVYGGVSQPSSYIDSGSNAWFFSDSTIPICPAPNTGFYCPTSTLSLSATMQPYNSTSPSFTYNFSIANANGLTSSFTAFNNLGAPTKTGTFDWGLAFFYGRSVYTAIEGTTVGGNLGPFYAASTP